MLISSYAKDTYFAPHLSEFTAADIPDMSHLTNEARYWIPTFILNSIFRVTVEPNVRRVMSNFLRRCETAYREYESARIDTTTFLQSGYITSYMRAISHWESFLAQAWLGYASMGQLVGHRVFVKGDGSMLEPVNELYNRSKHMEEQIARGDLPSDTMMPFWLTNNGIRSHDVELSFADAAGVLDDMVKWARRFRDPVATRDAALNGESTP